MSDERKLAVVWSSGDRMVALSMVFMYTKNSMLKGWWDRVRLVVWGPSSKLLTEDEALQKELKAMQEAGVEIQACRACADMHGVTDKLEALGIEVIYMGKPLTDILQSDWTCMTF